MKVKNSVLMSKGIFVLTFACLLTNFVALSFANNRIYFRFRNANQLSIRLKCYAVPVANDDLSEAGVTKSVDDSNAPSEEKKSGFSRLKKFFARKDIITADNLKKLGMSVLLSYGFVSNVSQITTVIIAWCIHGKTSRFSPLSPGQWKGFLAIYAGLWAANNFLRPARVSLSIIISPWLQKLVDKIESYSKLSRSQSVFLTVFLVNVVGTISYLVLGLTLVTRLLGLPLLP